MSEESAERKRKSYRRFFIVTFCCFVAATIITIVAIGFIKNTPLSTEEPTETVSEEEFDWDSWLKEVEKLRQQS